MKQTAKKAADDKKVFKKPAKRPGMDLPLSLDDYKWIVIGTVLVIVGYALLSGGGTDDPSVFAGDTLFSARRMTLAPITILTGMVVILYGILKKSKEDAEEQPSQQ